MRKSMVKKIGSFALAGAMMFGMTGNVMAQELVEEEQSLGNIGTATYYAVCDYQDRYGVSNVVVHADYQARSLYAYAWLEVDVLVGGRNYEVVDVAEDCDTKTSTNYVNAYVEIGIERDYNVGMLSDHYFEAALNAYGNIWGTILEED